MELFTTSISASKVEVSVTTSPVLSTIYKSLPTPPTKLSAPAPPSNVSLPAPPISVSFPSKPLIKSFPAKPSNLLLLASPISVSLPLDSVMPCWLIISVNTLLSVNKPSDTVKVKLLLTSAVKDSIAASLATKL